TIANTPNSADPSKSSDTISLGTGHIPVTSADGGALTLDLLGFADSTTGQVLPGFSAAEGKTVPAKLYARIEAPTPKAAPSPHAAAVPAGPGPLTSDQVATALTETFDTTSASPVNISNSTLARRSPWAWSGPQRLEHDLSSGRR